MADGVVLSGGHYGGIAIPLDSFKGDDVVSEGFAALEEVSEPGILYVYRLSEDKVQGVFVGVKRK